MAANGDGPAPRGRRWRMAATLMYPAAVCPPLFPGRFAARTAIARRRRRPSAPSAGRRSRRPPGRGRGASIAKSCRIGFGSTARGMPHSGGARRSARDMARLPLHSSLTSRSRRTSWCSRGRLRPRTRRTSTTRRPGSTTARLQRHRLRRHRSRFRGLPPLRPHESSSSHLLLWRQQLRPPPRQLRRRPRLLTRSPRRNSRTSPPSRTSPTRSRIATRRQTTGSVEGRG